MTQRISIVENILNANDQIASQNRALLDQDQVFSINLMASPGAGKTSLVEKTFSGLKSIQTRSHRWRYSHQPGCR